LPYQEIKKTESICKIDSFLLCLNETPVAGAIVYLTTPEIAQLVLWGDNREYSEIRPMNLFAMRLIEHCKERNFSHLDLGPASKNGIPNFGLSHFKSRMGSEITLKHTLML
jgi:lipid II:glycine glycyltransferase (peptidoglycan interpeptide bridge formation enzyme)